MRFIVGSYYCPILYLIARPSASPNHHDKSSTSKRPEANILLILSNTSPTQAITDQGKNERFLGFCQKSAILDNIALRLDVQFFLWCSTISQWDILRS
jgi:hypothetical protein